jgi:ribosomal protein S17
MEKRIRLWGTRMLLKAIQITSMGMLTRSMVEPTQLLEIKMKLMGRRIMSRKTRIKLQVQAIQLMVMETVSLVRQTRPLAKTTSSKETSIMSEKITTQSQETPIPWVATATE